VNESRIVHEDAGALAVDKASGRPTIPGRGDAPESVIDEMTRRLGRKLWVVHRLDADTSGVLVLAKDAEAHRRLCLQFEGRTAKKEYLAVVLGVMAGEGVIDAPLKLCGSGRVAVAPEGKPSKTRWEAARALRGATLIRAFPLTGRKHQIRVHLHSKGHSVLGDRRYGPPPRPVAGAPRLMLHARRLELEGLVVEAPPPPDFEAVVESLAR
jgi:RluA family pseudouridine synthase